MSQRQLFVKGQLLLMLLINTGAIKAIRIVQHPQDIVLLQVVTSLEESVEFLCKVELAHYGISWKINGSTQLPLDSSTRETFRGNVSTSVLTLLSRTTYNITSFQCIGRGISGVVESNEATLAYQGLLDAPNDISIITGLRNITISWSAPFSLNLTDTDPDIWYSVLIYNMTDELPATVSYPECINITEMQCIFIPVNPSPCHSFQFTITPQNAVGNGRVSEYFIGYIHGVPPGILLHEANITVNKRSTKYQYRVVITSSLHGLCFGELPEYFEMYYESSQENCLDVVSVVSSETPLTDDVMQITSDVQLGDNCNYTLHVVSLNEAGETNSTGTLSLSNGSCTRVIVVDVQQLNEEITVRCTFQHTLSDRCYVQLVSDVMNGFHEGVYLEGEREASHSFTDLVFGSYTVLVCGLTREEAACPPSGGPDYITVASVTAAQPTSVNSHPSITPDTGSLSDTTLSMSFLCAEGVGFGIGVGIVATTGVFSIAIAMVKIITKCQRKQTHSLSHKRNIAMDRNVAYEVRNPQHHRVQSGAAQTSQKSTPLYEDMQ